MSKGITYHIMTIAGIFIALGLGIFAGSMLNGEQLMMMQQSKIMSELGDHINEITLENKQLKGEIKNLSGDIMQKDQLIEEIFQKYLDGRLVGYDIAILSKKENEYCREISMFLESAGANILSTTVIKDFSDANILPVFSRDKYDAKIINKENQTSIGAHVAEYLMYSIISGQNSNFIHKLAEMDCIDIQGDYSQRAGYIIWIGYNQDGIMKNIDIPMMNIVKRLNVPSLVVDMDNEENSSIDVYKGLGFPIVDNIKTINGKLSLTRLMKESKEEFEVQESSAIDLPVYYFEKLQSLE